MPTNCTRRPIPLAIAATFPIPNTRVSLTDMIKAFRPIDQLLAALYQGEIDVEGSTPIMRDWDGWTEIVPAINGWCDCWERIARHMATPLDLGFLRRLANRLAAGILLDLPDVDRALHLVTRCRALYFACPLWLRKSAVQDELIAIALDNLCLREAA